MNNNLSVGEAASMLMGAGLVKITDDVVVGVCLIGVGVVLKIVVAVLNKNGVEVRSTVEGTERKG